ncbi:MAG: hypothetical protein AUH85_03500 [Chloroflexi bacterium 13_1_40CM_4_68_4]|nr:MAG: hypothetical protein AUH85_03500 [Chloroflexi bacterium 13_1_40CM_4_68_4]
MIPCGFPHQVASLARLGVDASVAEIKPLLARRLAEALDVELVSGVVAPVREGEIPEGAPVRRAHDLLGEPVPV